MRIDLFAGASTRSQALAWLAFAAFWLLLCALAAWEVAFDQTTFR